ncbi:MAG: aminopeptidase [Actinobacteria bacterium]|nr:MAG: aminopeptidase [Actinomycetota bacterium]
MPDPRVVDYAKLLVERCVDVQPGWQVVVVGSTHARPLVEEVIRAIGRRGAIPVVQLSFSGLDFWPFETVWAEEAPPELIAERSPIRVAIEDECQAWIRIGAPENAREGVELDADRQDAIARGARPLVARRLALEIPWVTCRYPTPAMAQEAGMGIKAFEDFLFGAVLLDWDAEGEKMQRIKERFDPTEEVRIVGHKTDLRFSIAGRDGVVDDGHLNMPGGEVFYCPVEDSTEGVVSFSEYPAVREPDIVDGVRMRYENGRVVEASATANEELLLQALDRDEGARVLGEFGIGCNPGIRRHMQNTLFDEKMYGTIHLAVGAGIPIAGGTNQSATHWDMVKDLRRGGRIECDGEVVQENGEWTF